MEGSVEEGDEDGHEGDDDFESEVELDSDFVDESGEFQQDDTGMCELAAAGWNIYREDRSDLVSVPIPILEHTLQNTVEFYDGNGKSKHRQYLCKVCSATVDPQTKSFESSYFCSDCTETFGGYVPPCARVRREEPGNTLTSKDPRKSVATRDDFEEKLRRAKPIKAHEILHVVGLLIARTLCGHTDGLEKHWSTQEDGAIPRGTFSRYMTRDRITTIARFLHFASTNGKSVTTVKAWKVRPVLQAAEKTFRRGYRMEPRISLDEGTIPNRSKFNACTTRTSFTSTEQRST
ncbi:PiggyBac transposable element-derived protein [Phytophthora cactorum]|nr:PiggyBac transposable element-derived protein [Phytophthora cactorum]